MKNGRQAMLMLARAWSKTAKFGLMLAIIVNLVFIAQLLR
jgi:hypothetical protein